MMIKRFAVLSTHKHKQQQLKQLKSLQTGTTNCSSNNNNSRQFCFLSTRKCHPSRLNLEEKHVREVHTKVGIFGDIHFQDIGLNRIIETGDWIFEQFKRENVTSVVCLGDVLNTRESVSVQSQSAAIHFFEKLATLDVPIHILLGNHDLNLKHDLRISSLDVLGMHSLRHQFQLYRDISVTDLNGQSCVMFPYLEHQSLIKEWIKGNAGKYNYSDMVAFGHLSLPGAIQRFQKDNTDKTFIKTYHDDEESGQNGQVPSYLTQFKYLISGHFHHHHYLTNNVLYCGSPMQHHFGDSGDSGRGICFYTRSDETEASVQFVQNPKWDAFRVVKISKESDLEPISQYKGKHVALIYQSPDLVPETIQSKLIKAGAEQVKKHSVVVKRVQKVAADIQQKDASIHRPGQSFEDLVLPYVSLFEVSQKKEFLKHLIKEGQQIIKAVNDKSSSSIGAQKNFEGNLKSVTIENFLGVQGPLEFDMNSLEDGVWYIEGNNGAGKSTLLEAVTWCLFNRFLRTDMKASYAVNDTTKKNCRVTVQFNNGYTIERFRKYTSDDQLFDHAPARKGNGVRVFKDQNYLSEYERGSIRDSQAKLEELIGINFDTFSKSVVVGESVFHFLSSDAKQRREMIEDLLGLNQFDLYLTEVRELKKNHQMQSLNYSYDLANLHKQISSSQEMIVNLEKQNQSYSNERDTVVAPLLAKLRDQIEELDIQVREKEEIQQKHQKLLLLQSKIEALTRQTIESLQNRLEENLQLVESLTESKARHDELIREMSSMEEELDSKQKEKTHLQIEISLLALRVETIQKAINQLESLIQSHSCPYCSQAIQECTLSKMKLDIQAQKQQGEDIAQNIAEYNKSMTNIGLSITQLSQQITIKKEMSAKYQNDIIQLRLVEQGIESTSAEILRYQNHLTNLEQELHEHSTQESFISVDQVQKQNEQLASLRSKHLTVNLEYFEAECLYRQLSDNMARTERSIELEKTNIQDAQKKLQTITDHTEEQEIVIACLNFWEKAFERRTRKIDDLSVNDNSTKQNNDSVQPSLKPSNKNQFVTMRSFLLEQSIDDLNKILRDYSALLGPNSMPVSFDYDFMIKEEYGKRSAGQRKRNHLVIFFGLFELVRQHSRFIPNFLMLDEVFDAIDKIGQQHVKEVINMIATQHVDKVFIITHNMLRSSDEAIGGYGSEHLIRAIMTDKGTKYEIL